MDSLQKQINQFYLPDWLTMELIASNFISFTPLFSYGTTVWSIHKKETSLGFSIDICATMMIASILRIAYYFITPYEPALLRQSIVMLLIQSVLLKVSLSYRPSDYNAHYSEKESTFIEDINHLINLYLVQSEPTLKSVLCLVRDSFLNAFMHFIRFFDPSYKRIWKFWQWESHNAFWRFLFRFTLIVIFSTLIFRDYQKFGELLGFIGLFVESLLPLPQILLLNQLKSVEGFKLLLLLSWLCGDVMKISYLVFGANNISMLFLFFATFQASLDLYIAFQYVYFKFYYKEEDNNTIELQNIRV